MYGIFNDNFPPVLDGVAITAHNYAFWLHKKGYPACVVTPYAPGADGFIKSLPYPVYRYPSVPIPLRPPYRYGIRWADFRFLHRLNHMPFEIIHAHCPFTSGALALHLARKKHIPLVATFHSKYRQDFERAIPYKHIVDRVINRIVHFYEQADEVWIPQASVEPTLREYGYKGEVVVVDNGSDMQIPLSELYDYKRQVRKDLNISEKTPVFLFVGQHIWEKNIAFLLEALARLNDIPFRCYMVGTGYAEEEIKNRICLLGLQEKVIMKGMIQNRQQLQSFYAAADLFLFPSLYDNAPLVLREAAAMHTPSVLINGSTAAENIRDGWNGLLSNATIEDYASVIRFGINHRDVLLRLGDNAANSLVRSWEDIVDEVNNRYIEIINRYAFKKQ